MRFLGFLLLALLSISSAAQAQTCPSGWGCVNIFSRASSYTGNNTASGSNSATPSSAECPSGAGTLTPAHNNIVCTLSGNVTLASPASFVAGTPYKITFTENGTGGYTVSLPTSGYSANSNLFSGSNLLISTGANTTSVVYLDAEVPGGSNAVMVTGIESGILPTTLPIVEATGGSATNNTSGGGATTLSNTINLTSGDTLVLVDTGCGNTSTCNTTAKPNISSISGTGVGTCTLTSNTRVGGGNGLAGTEQQHCAITATGSSVSVTVTWSATCYYCAFYMYDVRNLNSSPDAGIGNTIAQTSSAAMSVSTTAGTNGKNNFLVASFAANTTPTSGTGWTQDISSSGIGWLVEHQISNSTSAIAATGGQTTTFNANVGSYTP